MYGLAGDPMQKPNIENIAYGNISGAPRSLIQALVKA